MYVYIYICACVCINVYIVCLCIYICKIYVYIYMYNIYICEQITQFHYMIRYANYCRQKLVEHLYRLYRVIL